MRTEITEADAVADLQRVAERLGHPPKLVEYREHGDYSVPTVAKHFDGSFTAARAAVLGCADGSQPEHGRDELLAEIVGGEPSKAHYQEHGEYALSTITYRFDSWVEAKREAGVFEGLDNGPTREELIADLRQVDAEYSGPVSQVSYQEHGEWSFKTVQRKFGGWETACQEAGVTRPKKGPQSDETEALFADIRHLADKLGRLPSKAEYNELGRFSQQIAKSRLGSWNEAIRQAGFEPNEPGGQPGEMNANWAGGYSPYYGESWHQQRRAARERDNHECVACGMPDDDHLSELGWELEVHHITPVRKFDNPDDANDLENLITLCRTHHRKYEHLPAEDARALQTDG